MGGRGNAQYGGKIWSANGESVILKGINEKGKEKKLISVPLEGMMNINALYYIIGNLI